MPSTSLNTRLAKLALHWLGSAAALAGLLFVGLRLGNYWQEIHPLSMPPSFWLALAVAGAVHGIANGALALAWRQLLLHADIQVARGWALRVYGVSQLAKYVPGNLFHLAGRQAIGMSLGAPAGGLARSALWELLLIAAAGSLFAWLLLPAFVPLSTVLHGAAGFVISIGVATGLLTHIAGRSLALAFAWQMLFLIVASAIFVSLLLLLPDAPSLPLRSYPVLAGAYGMAWLAGLLAPGSPAGIGVRELVLLLLLESFAAQSVLLEAVLFGRLASIAGDCVFFAAASLIPARRCADVR